MKRHTNTHISGNGSVQPEDGASLRGSELRESDLTIIANGDDPLKLGARN